VAIAIKTAKTQVVFSRRAPVFFSHNVIHFVGDKVVFLS
jgi:hypothetical protein